MTDTSSVPSMQDAVPQPQDAATDGKQNLLALEDASFVSMPEHAGAATASSARTALTAMAAQLPLQLDLRVPLPKFRVQNLLSLEKGHVIETAWPHTEDLPLWSGGVQLVWTEFEVVDQKLGVRITRLA